MINEENQTKKSVQGETRTHVTLLQSSTKNIMFSVRLMNYLWTAGLFRFSTAI